MDFGITINTHIQVAQPLLAVLLRSQSYIQSANQSRTNS